MATPFLSGAAGNPASLKRKMAPQQDRNVPADDADMKDFLSNGGGFGITFGTVPRAVISKGGAPRTPLPGKAEVADNPLFSGDCDPTNQGQMMMLANVFAAYDNEDVGGDYRDWDFHLDGATAAKLYLTSYEDTDIIPRTTFFNWRCNGFTIAAAPGDNYSIEFARSVPNFHFWGLPNQTIGTGSTPPVILGSSMNDHLALDAADKDMLLLFTDAVDPITVDTKVGTGSAFAGNDQPYTLGASALRLLDETGGIYSALVRDQPRIFLPAGATITAVDEWTIPKRRVAWADATFVEFPIPSVNTRFFVDGEEINAEGGYNLTVAWEGTGLLPDTFGLQGGSADRTGDLVAILTPTRQIEDLTLQKALMTGAQVSAVIDGLSDSPVFGTTLYRFSIVLPSVRVGGESYGTDEGAGNRQEVITMEAGIPASPFVFDGRSFDSHCHVWLRNNIATLIT